MWDNSPSPPTAAEPPSVISVTRMSPIDIDDITIVTVTLNVTSKSVTYTGYIVYFWTNCGQDKEYADGNSVDMPVKEINVKPRDLVHTITVVTRSENLPSKPSLPFHSKTESIYVHDSTFYLVGACSAVN